MSVRDHWAGGFYFDRSHPVRNNVAIKAYKLLRDYTSVHPHCRIGCYLMVNGFSEFFSLAKLIPDFDLFANAAENDTDIAYEFSTKVLGVVNYDQLNRVYRLQHPICFEYVNKALLNELLGYSFNNAIRVQIDPDDISEIEGSSLQDFTLTVKYTVIQVTFGHHITIR